ncbi:HET-domain-containing protein [Staphylotrichum tortipilum]|uniref:HET-domain-containing protein n=1 Tax=Staphylotrichum tortipilum TaxID=2831512 RepID=A0AAN6MHK1_9PEZI|nr:HET-domain-containing protein [Staphylotrichum longicolle]
MSIPQPQNIYDPLNPPTHPLGPHIRLLTISPSPDYSSPLSVTLHPTLLLSAPPFDALSYVWGPPHPRETITCNGEAFSVTVNLAAALRRVRGRNLRMGREEAFLWADAICVNQQDLEERGAHVGFMGRVYQQAEGVVVHLGEVPQWEREEGAGGGGEGGGVLGGGDPLVGDGRWESLRVMLGVPWFTRAWVVQEVGLAREPLVMYAEEEFLYRDLMRLAAWQERCAPTVASRWGVEFSTIHGDWLDWSVEGAEAWKGDLDRTFLDLVNQASWLGCADHRDHIYSLLGHPFAMMEVEGEGTGKEMVVVPDYTKSVEDVYLELAVKLIRQPRGLRVLSAVEHVSGGEIGADRDSPSWVPLWKQSVTICTLGIFSGFYYNASGGLAPEKKPSEGRVLRVKGMLVDIVAETFPFDNSHLELPWTADSPRRLADTMKSIWEACIKREPRKGGPSLYGTDEGVGMDALSLTLVSGLTGYDSAESPEHFATHRANFRAYCGVSGLVVDNDLASGASPVGDAEKFWLDMHLVAYGRTFFLTERGYFGLGPRVVRPGDQCVVLAGAKVPFVVREVEGGGDRDGRWRLVGECYLHGIMNSEVTGSLGGDGVRDMELI